MHLTNMQIDRLLRGELSGADSRELRMHLDGCEPCARRHAAMALEDDEIADALAMLNARVEPLDVQSLMQRAARPVSPGARISGRGGARRRRQLGWAAGALLMATAAAAMPGSIARRWMANAAARDGETAPSPSPTQQTTADPVDGSGVSIAPGDSADVEFTSWQTDGAITIRLTDERKLRVWTGNGSSTFSVQPSGIRVRNDASRADHEVIVPSVVRRLRVIVGGEPVFIREGAAVVVGPPPGGDGAFSISLGGARGR